MTARPWKPEQELDGALARGDLGFAVTLAAEVTEDLGHHIDLATAARFLPLVARDTPDEFNAWALRWLSRWIAETPATIERAAEVAAQLADLPAEPSVFDALLAGLR